MKKSLLTLLITLAASTFPPLVHGQAMVEAWARRYNNAVDSFDAGYVVRTDSTGNVIVAGETFEGVTGSDLLLIKYSNAGSPQWTNRYDGPGHSGDAAAAMAIDGGNNILVCINSTGSDGRSEFATVKYSSAGVPLWTNRYHGPGIGNDTPTGVAVDASGNVFVTGHSFGLGISEDITTLKYSSAGVPLWTNRYNGFGSGSDYVYGVAVDGSGNAYVTGSTYSGTSYDLTTIAYSSAGAMSWVNRYGSSGNFAEAYAIAVAGTNVFVTGELYDLLGNYDYVTIAYSTAGVPRWTNSYNGPANGSDAAAAVAVSGTNVFVTGSSQGSGTSSDFATIAYSINGVALWTNRYNGPANNAETPLAMTVDASGNVFVTGRSPGVGTDMDYATVALSSAGTVLWITRYNGITNGSDQPQSIATDASGNVFVTGRSDSPTSVDCVTIKYLSNGLGSWTNRYNGVSMGSAGAAAVAVDTGGNIVVTGNSQGRGSGDDYTTIRYSSTGVPLWTNRYNGPGNLYDYANAVAVDTSSNVFVTGTSGGSGTDADYATIKYSAAGVALWTNRYDGPAHDTDEAQAIAVDGSGNVIVTGNSTVTNGSDYVTIKYSNTGVPVWTNRYNGPANDTDNATAVAVDASGNVIVTGTSLSSAGYYDYATIKYSSAGAPLWTNRYDGPPGNDYDEARALVVDGSGNVIVTGYSVSSSGFYDYATIKYSSAGVPLWTNRYDGPTGRDDQAQAIAVDSSNNVYVTGYSDSGSYYYVTIKYSSAGVPQWTNRYVGGASGDSQASAVAVDGAGTVFVTGYSVGAGTKKDLVTIAYTSAGAPVWTNRYHSPFGGDDQPFTSRSMAVAGTGSVVVVGSSSANYNPFGGGAYDFLALKYITVPILNIRRTATNTVAVSWPSPSTGFLLQQNTNVAGTNWSFTAAPSDDGTTKTFVTAPVGNRFYRLIQ
jgi:uncharacterized delta-60 repeat protein